MKILIFLTVLTVVVALYVTIIRPWLRKTEWAKPFFANPITEWIELHLFRKSETLMWARYKMGLGTAIATLQSFGAIDITPLVTALSFILPEQHRWVAQAIANGWPMVFAVLGMVEEFLRRDTTKPLERVAVPEAVAARPAVVAAEAQAVEATAIAVEVTKEVRAEQAA